MDADYLLTQLKGHESNSQQRFEELRETIKEKQMTEPVHIKNIFEPGHNPMAGIMPYLGAGGWGGAGAGAGAGLGAGLLGGVLGGALLGGRGGLFGREGFGGEGFVTPTQLQTATAGIIESNQNNAVLQTLGDIKGSIPLAEGQVQLALAGAQSDLTNLINSANVANLQGQFAINKNVSDTTAQIIATEVATQDVVQNGNAAIQASLTGIATQALQNTYALNTAIRDDGDKTRALITQFNDANLQRQLTTAQNEIIELRGDQRLDRRSRETEINVTQNVNQNQAQAQAQQQQQQQLALLQQIAFGLNNVTQIAHATNQNIIAGNTGAVTTAAQTASPTNVNTR